MVGAFACPECGRELALKGLSPGRQVQCRGCATWVEVPFLPRGAGWRRRERPRRRKAWESKALRAAIAFAGAALIALVGVRLIGGRFRSGQEQVMAELVASADRAEASGRYDVALREAEAALARSRKVDREGSPRSLELTRRRDRVSLREARRRLAALDGLEPDRAVGEALIIARRARTDPALAPLAGSIEAGLAASRLRQAGADLDAARDAFDRGRSQAAFEVAERLHDRAGELAEADARDYRREARALLEATVARDGATIATIPGRLVLGSPEAYADSLGRIWTEALRARGYLPQPARSPWRTLWDERALARASTRVDETLDEFYLQSKNRVSRIDGSFELALPGRAPWSSQILARTRTPLPDLPAYLAGHLATAGRRVPEAERRLHDDAKSQFDAQAARALRSIPPHRAVPASP